jgi:glutamyl-tRNA synthetase
MGTRVRFAPSPTGHLHIGGLRAALFNYYFAKKNNGQFIIRIEDTDHSRNKEIYTKAILDAFSWCNIYSDEEILYQSRRSHIYQKYIQLLLDSNNAYYSDEPDENGLISRVIKCRVDKTVSFINFNDVIRGNISFPITEFDDFIIVRSDGNPLYNLVVVIDDIEMKISHVIRGEEHLPNTPKQLLLYKAFGYSAPLFAHLPLILGSDKKKLSKRDSATSVMDYQQQGYLPEALCMYLLRLGWSYKDQEIFTHEEILSYFRLEDVHHAGAIFDIKKLLSVNQYFIKTMNIDLLYKRILDWNVESFKADSIDIDKKLIALYQSRASTLDELLSAINSIKSKPIYQIDQNNDYFDIKKNILLIYNVLRNTQDSFNVLFKNQIFNGIEKSLLYRSLRYGILGVFESPSIIDIMTILTKSEVLLRLRAAIDFLDSYDVQIK